jgi:hypothetical protein
VLIWYLYHYLKTGYWLFIIPSDGITNERSFDNVWGILRNNFVIGFIMVEYGRFFLWIGLLFLIYLIAKQKSFFRFINENKLTIQIFLISLFIIIPLVSLIKNPIGPRYFMINYILLILLFVVTLKWIKLSNRLKSIFAFFAIIFLISGHFWVFKNISNAWDSTLAHLPYFKAREQMNNFIVQNLPNDSIGCSYPYMASPAIADLSSVKINSIPYNLKTNKYILYSNISNDFEPSEIKELEKFQLVHETKNKWIFMRLYKRPE